MVDLSKVLWTIQSHRWKHQKFRQNCLLKNLMGMVFVLFLNNFINMQTYDVMFIILIFF